MPSTFYSRGTTLKIKTKELHKVYWGTLGRYIAGTMLKAFVEEIGGTEYEKLVEWKGQRVPEFRVLLLTLMPTII